MSLDKFFSGKYFPQAVLLLLILLAHGNILVPYQIENPDAGLIYPLLEKISGLVEYLTLLADFETFDFQPVRDLTFFADIYVFSEFGLIVTILFNCLLWWCACLVLLRILEEQLPRLKRTSSTLLVYAISVYPIFLQTINWGIARKHILAFLFTLLATRYFLLWLRNGKNPFLIVIFYCLSVLSLPISMAWPVWALLTSFMHPTSAAKGKRKLFTILFSIMVLILGINWAYYKTSFRFLEVYPRKVNTFEIGHSLLSLGLQFKQIIFPYNLSFFYEYGLESYLGIVAFIAFLGWLILKRKLDVDVKTWTAFAGVHLVVTLSSPDIYYDPYVLFPGVGFFIVLFHLFAERINKWNFALVPLILFWSIFTFTQNRMWKDSVLFYQRSYEANPNCSNAAMYSIRTYMSGKSLPNELYDYLQVERCLSSNPEDSPAMRQKKFVLQTMIYYFEEDIDPVYRESMLRELSLKHYYALALFAAYLVKKDRKEELEDILRDFNQKYSQTNLRFEWDFIFSEVVPDYCKKHELKECMTFSNMWKEKKRMPFF